MKRVLMLASLGVTLQACFLPVLAAEEPATQTKTGVVRKVDPIAGQVVVMVAREMTFTVTEATQLAQGHQAKQLTDLKVGDRVTLDYTREGDIRTARKIAFLASESRPVAHALGSQAANSSAVSPAVQIQTATTHPMKYYLSLPRNWSPVEKWPVVVAPSAHYGDKGKTNALFAAERDAREARFIIVSPLVINADRLAAMTEYRGAVADAISAADAATDGRDEIARAKFDSEGIRAVLEDVQKRYRGEDRVYITGFSSSTHVAYLLLFTHPELLKGVMINSGIYAGRGVDEEHIPLLNSPKRAKIGIKYIVGEADPHYPSYLEKWRKTKAELLRCGHPASEIETEVIKKGNSEKLNPGHNWFPARILYFFESIERTERTGD